VNGALVRGDDYARSPTPSSATARRRRAGGPPPRPDRLIDEELLVSAGSSWACPSGRGVRRTHRGGDRCRGYRARGREPSEADSRRSMSASTTSLRGPDACASGRLWCAPDTGADAPSAEARARAAAAEPRRRGGLAGGAARLGDRRSALPDALLSPAKLLDHLRPDGARAPRRAGGRGGDDPRSLADGVPRAQVIEREAEWVPPRKGSRRGGRRVPPAPRRTGRCAPTSTG